MARKPESSAKSKKPSRSERLATALRDNLRRRKVQERQRSGQAPDKGR